jgi:uncharacterized protein
VSRFLTAVALAAAALVVVATPAFAHVEFEPSSATAGSTTDFTLFAENEAGSPITKVELNFPTDVEIIVADLPTTEGFTATVVGGEVGGAATGITWDGSTDGDAELALSLGPLPDEAGRLQFQAIVTYENGEQDEWLEDWPEGAEEPETPGPVIDVAAVGATVTTAEEEEHDDEGSTETTEAGEATTQTTIGVDPEAADPDTADEDDDDGGNLVPILIGGAIIILVGFGATYLYMRRRGEA